MDGVQLEAAAPGAVDDSVPSSKEPQRVRVEFPETWLWSESSTGYLPTPAVICALNVYPFSWCISHRHSVLFSFSRNLGIFSTDSKLYLKTGVVVCL